MSGIGSGSPDEAPDVGDLKAFRRGLFERTICRWAEPLEAEPSYGLLARVTERHGHPSLSAFARAMLIEDGSDWIADCFEAIFCADMWNADELARLARWTPVLTSKTATIAGQTLRRTDFSVRTRRYCPGCLHESPHHRVWFDLVFMATCPFHDVPLTDDPDGIALTWAYSSMAEAPRGGRLSRPIDRVERVHDTLEAYALSRFGLLARETDAFAACSLSEVVRAAGLVGRLAVGGYRDTMPRFWEPGFDRAAMRLQGWDVLRRGDAALDVALTKVARQAPRTAFGKKNLFGWATRGLPEGGGFPRFLEKRMDVVAANLGLDKRSASDVRPAAPAPIMTVQEVASELGITLGSSRAIVKRLGLVLPRDGAEGVQLLVKRRDKSRIEAFVHGGSAPGDLDFASSATRGEAAEILGVSTRQFTQLVKAGRIRRISYSFRQMDEERFERADIDVLLDGLPVERTLDYDAFLDGRLAPHIPRVSDLLTDTGFDVARFVADVLSGELRLTFRTMRTGGFRAFRMELWRQPPCHAFTVRAMSLTETRRHFDVEGGMSRGEAAALLEVDIGTVTVLAQKGHLETVPGNGSRGRLKAEQVEVFARRWVAAKRYVEPLRCDIRYASRELRKLGIETLAARFGLKGVDDLVEAAADDEALGLAEGIRERDPVRNAWQRVARWLARNSSLFTCRVIRPDGSAVFTPVADYLPITVRYEVDDQPEYGWAVGARTYTIRAELDLRGKEGRKRADALVEVIEHRRRMPPGLTMRCDAAFGVVTASMAATIVCLHERGQGLIDIMSEHVNEDAPVIQRMLMMIRCSVEVGRWFDPDVFGLWGRFFRT